VTGGEEKRLFSWGEGIFGSTELEACGAKPVNLERVPTVGGESVFLSGLTIPRAGRVQVSLWLRWNCYQEDFQSHGSGTGHPRLSLRNRKGNHRLHGQRWSGGDGRWDFGVLELGQGVWTASCPMWPEDEIRPEGVGYDLRRVRLRSRRVRSTVTKLFARGGRRDRPWEENEVA